MVNCLNTINFSVNTMWMDILRFHKRFGIEGKSYEKHAARDHNFRLGFLQEELEEYEKALDSDNKPEALDALVDLVYVAMGTAYMYNWNFAEAWDRVHAANMAKVRASSASDSKRNHENDIVKPPGWQAPNLEDLV